jgi:hypothetical protein
MSDEIWKDIEGHPGYRVSSFGRVWSDKAGRVLKATVYKRGYPGVTLNGKNRYVHQLVAQAFFSNPDNKKTVNHKDGDKTNNHVDNLEWATYTENCLHAVRVLGAKGAHGATHPRAKLNDDQVREIRALQGLVPYHEVMRRFNVSRGTVYGIWTRSKWKHVAT